MVFLYVAIEHTDLELKWLFSVKEDPTAGLPACFLKLSKNYS